MSLYTRGGDKGDTSLLGGVRVPKDSLRVEVTGTLDETTSTLGLARATTRFNDIVEDISLLQGEFIDVMGELASGPFAPEAKAALSKGAFRVEADHVARLEKTIDRYQAERLPAKGFMRPGGSRAGAALDMARTFVRRAERRLVALARDEPVNPHLLEYFNRLSDLFYIMARIDEQREVAGAVASALGAANRESAGKGTTMTRIGLDDCAAPMTAGLERARAIGVPMVLAIADEVGRLVELRRMDDSLPVSLTLAPNKAQTAAALRIPTHELAAVSKPGDALWGIEGNLPGVTLVGGGFPLERGGRVIGAVGVSGGTVDEDMGVARAMVAAFTSQQKGS